MWLVSVVVRRYIIDILIIIITFPYSTCISSFFGSNIPISLFIFKCFFVLLYNYTPRAMFRILSVTCLLTRKALHLGIIPD